MDIVVWGAGTWGKRCMSFLHNYGINVVAFIDSNENKIGTDYFGVSIISLETFKECYHDTLVLIAIRESFVVDHIENILNERKVTHFALCKCPIELYITHVHEKVPFDEYLSEFVDDLHGKHVAVSGWNFFSLLLYDYLSERGALVSWLVLLDERDRIYDNALKDYNFVLEDELEAINIKQVFCTSAEKKYGVKYQKRTYFIDFNIPRYRNNNLKKFFRIHDGKRCFVVANGPSLEMADLQCLYEHKELCFGVNGIYHAFHKTDWRPDFYVASDPNMFENFGEYILSADISYKFLGDTYASFWKRNLPSNIYHFHLRAIFDLHNEIPISDDISICTYDAATVIHSVLQFAFYMGFKEIYIIGADCQMVPGKTAYFDENYCVVKDRPYRLQPDLMMVGYEAIKKYADLHGIRIYNATRGGALDVFERVNFDELF